jgi:hypothetical protein
MTVRAHRLAIAGVGLLGLVAAGCSSGAKAKRGSSTDPGGSIAGLSASQITTKADDMIRSVGSGHVTGTGKTMPSDGRKPVEIDIRYGTGGSAGQMTHAGARAEFVVVSKDAYLKASGIWWKQLFASMVRALKPETTAKLSDRWVKVNVDDDRLPGLNFMMIGGSSLLSLTEIHSVYDDAVLEFDNSRATKAEPRTVQGVSAMECRDPQIDQTIYLAADGTFHPLQVDGGPNDTHLAFSDYDKPFTPQVPPGQAVDFDSIIPAR